MDEGAVKLPHPEIKQNKESSCRHGAAMLLALIFEKSQSALLRHSCSVYVGYTTRVHIVEIYRFFAYSRFKDSAIIGGCLLAQDLRPLPPEIMRYLYIYYATVAV